MLDVRDAPAQTTFARLMEAVAEEPSWKQVSFLVRICVRYADETDEEVAGLAEHPWATAFTGLTSVQRLHGPTGRQQRGVASLNSSMTLDQFGGSSS
ncbi:hypothetical protein [Streptomyces sp. NPDC057052]|uniref:hypothetical protein n=1 Tax=Streptomyces sp. NPDC057052 TaxID=3346010 RepID=UPI0036300CC3